MKRWVALALLAAACAPEPAAAPPQPAPWVARPVEERKSSPPAAEQNALDEIDRALKYMAEVRELPVKDQVAGTVIAREALLARLRSEVEDDLDPSLVLGNTEFLFALNLAPARFDFLGSVLELFTSEIAGFYDPGEKRMYLLADLDGEARRATLWHELVHALQDQHYDLRPLVKWKPDEGDRVSALQCLSEGDATSAMMDAILSPQGKRAIDVPGSLLKPGSAALESSPKLAHIPGILRRSVIAPYADGLDFTHHLRRLKGWAGVDSAWRSPPLSTEQVLHPEKYIAGERPEPPPLPPPPAGGPSELVYRDVVGEQALRLIFEDWMPASTAAESASGWSGDRVAVYKDGDSRAVAIRLRYDDEAMSLRAATAFVRGGRTPEIDDQPTDGRPALLAVTADAAQQAFKTGRFCQLRARRGPQAVVRRGRDFAVVAGTFSRAGSNAQGERTCDQALKWADQILSAR